MSVFLEESAVTDEDMLRLFSLYYMYLKDVGKVPWDYYQALQGGFCGDIQTDGFVRNPRILLARSCEY